MKELAVIAAGIAAAVACAGETGVDRIDGSIPFIKPSTEGVRTASVQTR